MHPGAWMAWVGTVMVMALATTNPFYLAVLLLCVLLVAAVAPRTATGAASFRVLLVFGLSMMAVSVVIATINGNYGDHILFTIPGPEIPEWLGGLRLGGPVSAEGLVAAAVRGLAIMCILLAFGVFNGAVSPHRVLRTTPGALFHASLVVTVGLTLLPSSIDDLRRIREMRALRGARGGLRDLPALVVPAVINGLERSMQLAEAMEARGYAAGPATPRPARIAAAASAPAFIFGAWSWFYTSDWRWLGAVLGAAGCALLAYWFWSAGRSRKQTSFADEPMPLSQRVAASGAAVAAVLFLALRATGDGHLLYNPFDGLPAPRFALSAGLLAASNAWPAVLLTVFPARKPAAAVERPVAPEVPA